MSARESLHRERFKTPIAECDVEDKRKLESYRALWLKWMRWYDHSPSEPNTIESQLHSLMFNDLVYRSVVGARSKVAATTEISARASVLVYLLDTGYVATQVMALLRLLDKTRGAVSVMRLLLDVESKRTTITREVYVSGFGLPYEPESWKSTKAADTPMVAIWGLEALELRYWSNSDHLHKTFDRLSNTKPEERSRTDLIQRRVFQKMHAWLQSPAIAKLEALRNEFLAHAGDVVERKAARFENVLLQEIDGVQKAIVRTERALTDCVLTRRIAREVVPMPPLGLFAGLVQPYTTSKNEEAMYRSWDGLAAERNGWTRGVLGSLCDAMLHRDLVATEGSCANDK